MKLIENAMNTLEYTIPAIVVFVTTAVLTWLYFRNDEKKRRQEIILNNQKQVTPIRLQAYERLALLLERISPENLVIRVKQQGMNSSMLQTELLKTIRSEFDHNLSQQVYISSEAWEKVVEAKEHTVKLINTCALEVNAQAPAMELSKMVLQSMMSEDVKSPHAAIEVLKKEMRIFF